MIKKFGIKEREMIESLLMSSYSWEDIEKALNINRYTIRNEVLRNGGRVLYKAKNAQKRAEEQEEKRASVYRGEAGVEHGERSIQKMQDISLRINCINEKLKKVNELLQQKSKIKG